MYPVGKIWHRKDAHSPTNYSINSVKSQSNSQRGFSKNLQTNSKILLEEKTWRNIKGNFEKEVLEDAVLNF